MTGFREAIQAQLAAQMAPGKYRYPGTDAPIAVQLLSEGDYDMARVEAQRYARKLVADLDLDPEFLEREVQRQVVWRSMLEPEPSQGAKHALLFPSDSDIRALDTVTVEALFRLYVEHQETRSDLRQYTPTQIADLVARIRKNPKAAERQFSSLDHDTLVRILVSFAASPP